MLSEALNFMRRVFRTASLDRIALGLPLRVTPAQPLHLGPSRLAGHPRGLEALPALGPVAIEDQGRALVRGQLRQRELVLRAIEGGLLRTLFLVGHVLRALDVRIGVLVA